jgi:hypothetical protein
MTSNQFRELCRGAARVLNLSDIDALFDDAGVRIDGVRVGVFRKEGEEPPGVYCYADLGPVAPGANAVEMMEEALAVNLELDGIAGAVIGMERDSRHFVLRVRLPGGDGWIDETILAEELRSYAALANELYEKVLTGIERPA